jgi:hypothetical protein
MFSVFLRVVGSVQLVLGLAYLLAPGAILASMGHTVPAPDLFYPLGMLAARFIAYGLGFWLISRQAGQNLLWVGLMALIQAIDLGVGVYYTASGVVPWQLSAFPMFNAVWIGLVCALWAIRQRQTVVVA